MGIVRMSMNYVETPDWAALFASARKLDIYLAYGRTWRNNNLERLRKLALTADARIRVYLPDPDDVPTIEWMAQRFGYTPTALVDAIREARAEYAGLQLGKGATVEIYRRTGEAMFSCYRFDGTAVLTLYSHSRTRQGIPTFVCRDGGQLYDFIRREFDAIANQSHIVYPTSAATGGQP